MKRRSPSADDAGEDDAPLVFEAKLVRVRRNWILLGLALGIAPFVAMDRIAALFSALAFACVWRWNVAPSRRPTRVRAGPDGIELGGERIPRTALEGGFVIPRTGGTSVLLRRPLPHADVTLAVRDVAEGQRLLTALGLDAAHSVARVRGRALPFGNTWFHLLLIIGSPILFFAAFNLFGEHTVEGMIGAILGILAIVAVSLVPSKIVIGADGIDVSWFGKRRFIRYADVEYAGRFTSGIGNSKIVGVEISMTHGRPVRLPISSTRSTHDETEMVLERIREAMAVHEARGGAHFDAQALARGSRDVDAWVRSLRGIGAGANASMRDAPVDRDRLWRLVENPQLDAGARAAAAVALGGDLDAAGKTRLIAASKGVAAEKLRVAIEAATTEDEAAMGAALAELEADEAAAEHARA